MILTFEHTITLRDEHELDVDIEVYHAFTEPQSWDCPESSELDWGITRNGHEVSQRILNDIGKEQFSRIEDLIWKNLASDVEARLAEIAIEQWERRLE